MISPIQVWLTQACKSDTGQYAYPTPPYTLGHQLPGLVGVYVQHIFLNRSGHKCKQMLKFVLLAQKHQRHIYKNGNEK